MTNEQVGLYMRMLCAQHQHGGRIDTNVLRTQCDSITGGDTVFNKFEHDERGSFNRRLEIEMERRREKGEKARNSVNKRWEKRTKYERNTNVIRSESENEIENVKENKGGAGGKKNQSFIPPTLEQAIAYVEGKGFHADLARNFFDEYEPTGWRKKGGVKIVSWERTLDTWMRKPYNSDFKKATEESKTSRPVFTADTKLY